MGAATNVALVFLGGGAGAVLRYAFAMWAQGPTKGAFPVGTFVVNALGCLLIGLAGVALMGTNGEAAHREPWRLALVVGVLGGFTTFSAFSWDVLSLIEHRRFALALGYVAITNVVCIVFAAGGYRLGLRVFPA